MKRVEEAYLESEARDHEDGARSLQPRWAAVPGRLLHAGCNSPSHLTFFTRDADGRLFAICASCGAVMDMEKLAPVD